MTDRIEKWDILKLFLMFTVVLGHIGDIYYGHTPTVDRIFIFIYSFHMPLFMFVSGLFSKRNINEKRYEKIFSYFILYLLTKVLMFLSAAVFKHDFTFSLLSEYDIPWYGFGLFNCSLAAIALRKFPRRYVLMLSIALACFAGYDPAVSDLFVLSRTIVFFPFFYAGYCLDAQKLGEAVSKWWIRLLSGSVLAAFAVFVYYNVGRIYWLRAPFTARNPFSAFGDYAPYGGLVRLIYYPASALLGLCVISLVPNRLCNGVFARFGARSEQIFAMHKPVLDLIYILLPTSALAERLCPQYAELAAIPVALLVVWLCGLGVWSPIFKRILHPKLNNK